MKAIPRKLIDRLFRKERDEALIQHDPRFWRQYVDAKNLVVRGVADPAMFDGAIRHQLEEDADLISFEQECLASDHDPYDDYYPMPHGGGYVDADDADPLRYGEGLYDLI